MPIYAFECDACGHQFDRLQKLSDPDPTDCPECGASRVRRQLTAPAFRLSGSGWYETDFKKDGDKKRNLADKGADKGEAAKSDGGGKTESAPAAAPAAKPAESAPAAKPADTKAAT
jgi:putative FmdB family regulatory protein